MLAHADVCESCRLDAACGPLVVRAVERARSDETWRPSSGDALQRRIGASRASRSGRATGALGWAVALSLALNVAAVSGIASRVHDTFATAPEPASVASGGVRIELESKRARARVAFVPLRRHPPRARFVAQAPPAQRAEPPAHATPPPVADVPDVLAGLDLSGRAADAEHVALSPPCETQPADPPARETPSGESPSPCESPPGAARRRAPIMSP